MASSKLVGFTTAKVPRLSGRSVLEIATAAGKKTRGASSYREYQQQCLFAQRCDLHLVVKQLAYTASMNGVNLGPRAAYQAKAKGVKRGFPDWMLYHPSRFIHQTESRYIGLALEFKDPLGKGKVSADQDIVAEKLRNLRWIVECPTTAAEAWTILCDYLGIKE